MAWPEWSFRKKNYRVYEIDFSKDKPPYFIAGPGDYINVIKSDPDLSSIYISLNGGTPVPMNAVIPLVSPFSQAVITWDTSVVTSGKLKLIVGRELFRPNVQTIQLITTKFFTNTNTRQQVSAANNTAGVEASLFNDYRSVVDVWVSLGGAGTIEVYVSIDGTNWRKIDSVTLGSAGEWNQTYRTGFPWVKVKVPTTGIDVTIEIAANV